MIVTSATAVEKRPVFGALAAWIFDQGRVQIKISRRILYAQAILIVVVAILAFGLGFLMGSGRRPQSKAQRAGNGSLATVTGRVFFRSDDTSRLADAGAVVIVLPAVSELSERIASDGLRPPDPYSPEGNMIKAIESLDGAYARADEGGAFQVSVPQGNYLVLVISNHAKRPKGSHVARDDAAQLRRFFASVPDLLGDAQYSVKIQSLAADSTIDRDFPPGNE